MNPSQMLPIVDYIPKNKYHIGVWNWELEEFPSIWDSAFNYIDEIWTPSAFTQKSIQKSTNKKVSKVPIPINTSYNKNITKESIGISDDVFVFYAMFDFDSAIERKNPEGIINAFKSAFDKENSKVCLILKITYNNETAAPQTRASYNKLIQMLEGYPNIFILNQYLVKEDLNALVNLSDCFVSLHRSEGYGLGPAEAMAMGKPVISTNWSATTEFMSSDSAMLVDYKLTKVFGYFYDDVLQQSHQMWADPDVEHAASFMKKIYSDEQFRNNISKNAKKVFETDYSLDSIAKIIQEKLGAIK
jgi:glycosyltransferase involved in cell wall biosynthesis